MFKKKKIIEAASAEPADAVEVGASNPAASDFKQTPGASKVQPQAAAPKKTVSQVLGEITWLLTQSPIHKQLFIGDLEWFAMPPLLLEQFRVFHGKEHPAGVALWARVSEETDQRLRHGAFKLRPDEWKSGDIPWLIELVAPFGGQQEMMADLSAALFPNEAYNYHQVGPDGSREVVQFEPAGS
ncbi:MAG: hypothetical protein Hens3KO_06350 [Henriciella sp.]